MVRIPSQSADHSGRPASVNHARVANLSKHCRPRFLFALAAAIGASAATGQTTASRTADDGTIQVPAFSLPFSDLASPEARAAFVARQRTPVPSLALPPSATIADMRRIMDEKFYAPIIARQNAQFKVTMTPRTIGGVYTEVFTPDAGVSAKNRNRVLIDLHGGGFLMGARAGGRTESAPIAATGRITVISVDYREGPENKFPAASEDVAAVYRELLKTHKAGEIGIYGCSAGGVLSGQAIAWFQKVGLPNPAGIGVLCAAIEQRRGDSAQVTPRLGGTLPAPNPKAPPSPYLAMVGNEDPLAYPAASPALLARFPPTLLITGTRASEMSSAARSHIDLVKAGVDARLFVWDGMDHGFWIDPDLPESHEAWNVIVNFFAEAMDRAATGHGDRGR